MRGAIVFLAAFVIFLVVTIGYQDLPPGRLVYDTLGLPETFDYDVLGLDASVLIIAIFNGVVYGVIIWFIFWLLEKVGVIPKGKQTVVITKE
ncbi:MAG: hypothetical protein JSV05_09975 [Candidatus Bathyarchaeota archaeon]|nr:MAG: hypothetical protein JSV05_09975 [Candidatus Bathyarchaeota archaeon]